MGGVGSKAAEWTGSHLEISLSTSRGVPSPGLIHRSSAVATLVAPRLVRQRGDHQSISEKNGGELERMPATRENRRPMARDPLPSEALMAKLDVSSALHLRQGRLVEQGNFVESGLFGRRFLAVSPSFSPTPRYSSGYWVGGLLSVD